MIFTVASIAALGVLVLHLSLGVAVLLGAMIAPTDPVLAHDVGVRDAGDVELVRFSLSGEGGINDGTAYPCATLGLFLCSVGTNSNLHWGMIGSVAWGIVAGVGAGWLLGFATARLVAFLRSRHGQALGLEGFFALGLIILSYGVTLAIHGYGFLAVFAAGVAMRRVEHRSSGQKTSKQAVGIVDSEDVDATSTDPGKAHAFVAESVMGFTIELEHIAEAVLILLIGSRASHHQCRLISWFGIRGVGSLYHAHCTPVCSRPSSKLPLPTPSKKQPKKTRHKAGFPNRPQPPSSGHGTCKSRTLTQPAASAAQTAGYRHACSNRLRSAYRCAAAPARGLFRRSCG